MAADVGWFRRSLNNISSEVEVIENLKEIRIALTSVNGIQMKTLALNLDLGIIFDCLNSSDNLQIELGCHVLEELLPCLEPSVLLNKYGVAMHRALSHPNEQVKQVVLTEMCRAVKDSDLVSRMGDQQALLLSVVDCIGHENMSVAKIAIAFLVWMGQTPSYLATLFSPQLLNCFNSVKKKNDTTRFRVFEVIVEVSSISIPGVEASHTSGLLTELIDEAKQNNDILTKLAAIELLTKLALTYHGMEYLEKHGVTDQLASEIVACQDGSSLEALIVPGIMKFFGNIAQFWPKDVFKKYSKVIGAIFDFSNSSNSDWTSIALETIGYVATTPQGKLCLQEHGAAMSTVMQRLNQLITSAPADTRVRPLNTIANIIGLEVVDQTSELLKLTEEWYLSLSESNPTVGVLNICHLPFPDLRLAGFLILHKMSVQVWGQQQLLNCPGLIEFLLDRDVEPSLECKTSKFKVVQTLVESNTSESVFGDYLFQKLVDFVREGPCFVQTQTEVAIEGAA